MSILFSHPPREKSKKKEKKWSINSIAVYPDFLSVVSPDLSCAIICEDFTWCLESTSANLFLCFVPFMCLLKSLSFWQSILQTWQKYLCTLAELLGSFVMSLSSPITVFWKRNLSFYIQKHIRSRENINKKDVFTR